MRRASTCCARGRRSCCCCQKGRCHRAWPDHRETSSVVQNVCRYRHPGQRDSVIALGKSTGDAFPNADVCSYFYVPMLPDDFELDWCQTGGRPVWEGQRQCHRQSQQHLHALRRCRRHEDLCGGERRHVAQRPLWVEPIPESYQLDRPTIFFQ